jgi:hypothetical protein
MRTTYWCCGADFGQHTRACPNFDRAADGPEVEIIRQELQIRFGVTLHWTDRDGQVVPFPYPITTQQANALGIRV